MRPVFTTVFISYIIDRLATRTQTDLLGTVNSPVTAASNHSGLEATGILSLHFTPHNVEFDHVYPSSVDVRLMSPPSFLPRVIAHYPDHSDDSRQDQTG